MNWDVGASTPRRSHSAFAVIVRRSRVLLVRARGATRWQLPGGRIERRETPRQGARREVLEETGLDARIRGLTGVYGRRDGSVAVVFAAEVGEDAEPAGPRYEIREQRWVRTSKALSLLRRSARRRLADALAAAEGLLLAEETRRLERVALRRIG